MNETEDFPDEKELLNHKVKRILDEHPKAREDDCYYLTTFVRVYSGLEFDFSQIGYSVASIVRERRRVQLIHPELQAPEEVRRERQQISKEYREYYGKHEKRNKNERLSKFFNGK